MNVRSIKPREVGLWNVISGLPGVRGSRRSPLEGVIVDQSSKETATKTDLFPEREIGILETALKPL